MTTERNRLEPIDRKPKMRPDAWPSDFRRRGNQKSVFAQFVVEFRPVLSNMLQTTLGQHADIDSIVEETVNRFHLFQRTCNWHKPIRLRRVVESQLDDVLLNHVLAMNVANTTKQFSISWRNHLLSNCWHNLQHREKETGKPYFSVLRRRYEKPWLSNSLLLQDLSDVFATLPCKQSFRVFLYRCEQRFAREVVSEVAETIHLANSTAVCSEVASLDLGFYWERLATDSPTYDLANSIQGPQTV